MNRNRLFTTISLTASSFVVWLYIVTQIQPNTTDTFIMVAFFLTLIMWIGSALSYLFFRLKVNQSNKEVIYAHIAPSLRQGFIIAATIAALLFLQLLRVISLWDAALVLFVALLFELALRNAPVTKTARPAKGTV